MEEKIIIKRPPKSPGLAGVLAFFFPFGTGALYNNQVQKALIFFISFAGLVTLQTSGRGQPFLGLTLFGFLIYQIYDAVQSAKIINRRAELGGEEELLEKEEFPEPLKSGSIFWGTILMALGGILLLANFEVIDYDTLFDFWPVVVIVIGMKLIFDYFRKNKEDEGE